MRNSLLFLVSALLISVLQVKATEYIYPGSFGLIGDSAYTIESNNNETSLVKYSFPALVEGKRVSLDASFPNVIGSTSGFLVNSGTDYVWTKASDEDKSDLKKYHSKQGNDGFAQPASQDILTETTHYVSYNTDLEKVAERDVVSVYTFETIYEDDPFSLNDDNLAGVVEDKFCGDKKKGKKRGKCKKLLLRTK